MLDSYGGRLYGWKSNFFNQLGRTILTQTVLDTLGTHQMYVFCMLKKLTNRIYPVHR